MLSQLAGTPCEALLHRVSVVGRWGGAGGWYHGPLPQSVLWGLGQGVHWQTGRLPLLPGLGVLVKVHPRDGSNQWPTTPQRNWEGGGCITLVLISQSYRHHIVQS